jgi:AraC-like DNA-binding protein
VRAARSIGEFLQDRFGHYLFGAHFLVWCADPSLGGVVFWGTPDEGDVRELVRIFNVSIAPELPVYDVVTDGRRLERVTRHVFDPFARAAVARLREQNEKVSRNAIIAPDGLIGAIMAGFFPLFGLGDRFKVFREAEAAFRWLDRAEVSVEVDALVEAHLGQSAAVMALRGWLLDHLGDASLSAAARAVGRSARSLQRELGELGSSFRSEHDRARVVAARVRLAESDDKLEVIARELGCSSLSSFSRLFRRVSGEAPTDYRQRARVKGVAG